ncbi:MAG: helix-turn-helix transcriptional regulator [Phenylobacterium sp.]|nr:helix-turn-helix transcriptional regulator [Phenylobacterium sp.]
MAAMVDIEDIYDAAFDRERFARLLSRILAAVDAQAGFLGWFDMTNQARFEVQHGNDPAFLQSYAETYAAHDILRPELMSAPEGVVMHVYDRLQSPEIRESVFYREWLAPQGMVDNLAINLIKREEMSATLAVLRTGDAPPFGPQEIGVISALVPHLKRAVYMQSRLVHQANLVRGYQRITSGARHGMVLLDEAMRVLDVDHATQAATGLRQDAPLGASAFERGVIAAVRDGAPVAVRIDSGDDATSVTLLCVARPLERDPFGDLAGGVPVAHAVHIVRVDHPARIAFDNIAELYGLTPTETRVMADAFVHADLTRIGERLGMARGTARTHLHRIYEKTETDGFASLCLLAHRFALPV